MHLHSLWRMSRIFAHKRHIPLTWQASRTCEELCRTSLCALIDLIMVTKGNSVMSQHYRYDNFSAVIGRVYPGYKAAFIEVEGTCLVIIDFILPDLTLTVVCSGNYQLFESYRRKFCVPSVHD